MKGKYRVGEKNISNWDEQTEGSMSFPRRMCEKGWIFSPLNYVEHSSETIWA